MANWFDTEPLSFLRSEGFGLSRQLVPSDSEGNNCASEAFGLSRQLVPSDSEGNNCASEATQILRLNNEQNLRYLNILAYKK